MAYTFRMMEDELQITLTNDYAFKRLLGSEENKPLLQDLLECILDLSPEDVSELELMDKELTKEELSDKTGILDVKLKLTNGTVIDIEISFSDRHPCLSENTSFAIRQNIAYWQDVSGCKQKQVFCEKNLQFKNVQGRTFLNDAIRAASEITRRHVKKYTSLSVLNKAFCK